MDIRVYACGIDTYELQRSLRFCANDAELIASTMSSFDQAQVVELLTAPADSSATTVSHGDLRRMLGDIEQLDASASDLIVFFFAGHGWEHKGTDYLLASDSDVGSVDAEASSLVATNDVVSALRASGAGYALMIIDACRADGSRGPGSLFGENTRDAAAKKGVVSIYACLPGQASHEHESLGPKGQGVFTFAMAELLEREQRLVPALAHSPLMERVQDLCGEFRLSPQTPEIAVTSVAVTNTDLLTGRSIRINDVSARMILLAGPPYTGKSTVGARLAQQIGFTHVEMSTYAHAPYQKARDRGEFRGTIQEYMDQVVWKGGDYDRVAQDLLSTIEEDGARQLVVCGPRRVEEIEAFWDAGFEVEMLYIYSDSRTRHQRYMHGQHDSSLEYAVGLESFVRRDLLEQSWGLPRIGLMKDCNILENETVESAVAAVIDDLPPHWRPRRTHT